MNITGNIYRFFSDVKSGAFVFENIQTNACLNYISGDMNSGSGSELRLGLTGITGDYYWYFSLKNGKMYDPEGRFFACYTENNINTISGNFSTGNYDYYLNNELVCAVGKKKNISFNGWYINPISGSSGSCDSITISTSPLYCSVNFPKWFYLNNIWSGNLFHNSQNPICVYSGELYMPDSIYFTITGTGLSFNNGNNVIPSGGTRAILLNQTGLLDRTGIFTVGLSIYTDFGKTNLLITGSGLNYGYGTVSNYLNPSTGCNFTISGSGVTGNSTWYFSESYISYNGGELSKTPYVSLSLASGYTGQMTYVTGLSITNSGKSYTSIPIIYITPTGGGFPIASGSGILGGPSNTGITGVNWVSTGIYTGNTASYNVSINGGGGNSFAATPLWGSGYIKTFSGQYDLITGVWGGSGSVCNKTYNLCSGLVNLNTGNLLFINLNYIGLPDTAPSMYSLNISCLSDSTTNIGFYSLSGINYKK